MYGLRGWIRTSDLLRPRQAGWPNFPTHRYGLTGGIRTPDLMVPNQAFCQAELLSDVPVLCHGRGGGATEKSVTGKNWCCVHVVDGTEVRSVDLNDAQLPDASLGVSHEDLEGYVASSIQDVLAIQGDFDVAVAIGHRSEREEDARQIEWAASDNALLVRTASDVDDDQCQGIWADARARWVVAALTPLQFEVSTGSLIVRDELPDGVVGAGLHALRAGDGPLEGLGSVSYASKHHTEGKGGDQQATHSVLLVRG